MLYRNNIKQLKITAALIISLGVFQPALIALEEDTSSTVTPNNQEQDKIQEIREKTLKQILPILMLSNILTTNNGYDIEHNGVNFKNIELADEKINALEISLGKIKLSNNDKTTNKIKELIEINQTSVQFNKSNSETNIQITNERVSQLNYSYDTSPSNKKSILNKNEFNNIIIDLKQSNSENNANQNTNVNIGNIVISQNKTDANSSVSDDIKINFNNNIINISLTNINYTELEKLSNNYNGLQKNPDGLLLDKINSNIIAILKQNARIDVSLATNIASEIGEALPSGDFQIKIALTAGDIESYSNKNKTLNLDELSKALQVSIYLETNNEIYNFIKEFIDIKKFEEYITIDDNGVKLEFNDSLKKLLEVLSQ